MRTSCSSRSQAAAASASCCLTATDCDSLPPLCATFLGLPEDTSSNPERYGSFADILKASTQAGSLSEADLDHLLQMEQRLRDRNTPFTLKVKVHARMLEIKGAIAAEGTYSLSFFDITEQEKQSDSLHKALREADLVRTALNRLSQAVCIKNTDHQYIYVNDAYCRMHGLPRTTFSAKRLSPFTKTSRLHGSPGPTRRC